MAKGRAEVHQQRDLIQGQGGALSARERLLQTVDHNDFPIPDAAEMAGYNAINPAIVMWMLEHASLEQRHRHQSNDRFLAEFERDGRSLRRRMGWGMVTGFLVFMAGLGISSVLVYKDHGLAGSILGGSTLVGATALFVNQRRREENADAAAMPTYATATTAATSGTSATIETPPPTKQG